MQIASFVRYAEQKYGVRQYIFIIALSVDLLQNETKTRNLLLGGLSMNKFNNEIENAIKIINNAISEGARNNINPIVVEVPCVGR